MLVETFCVRFLRALDSATFTFLSSLLLLAKVIRHIFFYYAQPAEDLSVIYLSLFL